MQPSIASQGLLFGSFLFRSDLHTVPELKSFWENQFGKSFSLVPSNNPLAGYYSREMGENLSRVFLLSTQTFPREFLLSVKLESLNWEQSWSVSGKRMVNADIGFLTPENFLLATTKNYSHRVYLGQNIFADLTYYFHQNELTTLPWSYPDYLDPEKKEFFLFGRTYLLQQLT